MKLSVTVIFFFFCFRTEAEGGEVRSVQVIQQQRCITRYHLNPFFLIYLPPRLVLSSSSRAHLSPDCRSFSSSLWTNEPSFLGHVTSLSSSFTPNPRMHHLPALSYSSQPTPYSSYLSSPPPPSAPPPPHHPPPPPLSHSGPFQSGSFYYGPNQPHQPAGEDRNVTTLSNYIEGACLSIRGEEPVWRPY